MNNDVPGFKQLDNPRYFRIDMARAFWAFLAGLYGDQIIRPMFVNTALYGLQSASLITLGLSEDQLSERFQMPFELIMNHFLAIKRKDWLVNC
jgi:hypothetical protein